MQFRDLDKNDRFQFPKGIDLRGFGPQCSVHKDDTNRQCSFVKTTFFPPPRSYFGGSDYTNAERLCDHAKYDFTSVNLEVTVIP